MRRATSPATPNSTCTCRSPTRRTRPRSRPPASSSQRWKCKARPPPAARRPRRAPPRHPPAATEPRLSFHRKALLRKGLFVAHIPVRNPDGCPAGASWAVGAAARADARDRGFPRAHQRHRAGLRVRRAARTACRAPCAGLPARGRTQLRRDDGARVPGVHRAHAQAHRRGGASPLRRGSGLVAAGGRAGGRHRHAVQGTAPARGAGPGDPARSAGADAGRTHRRPRPQPEAHRAPADRRDGARAHHPDLHAPAGGSARLVQSRGDRRAREAAGRRHARRAGGAFALPRRGVVQRAGQRGLAGDAGSAAAGGFDRGGSAGRAHHRVSEAGRPHPGTGGAAAARAGAGGFRDPARTRAAGRGVPPDHHRAGRGGGERMSPVNAVLRRELRSFFVTPMAYVFLVMFLVPAVTMRMWAEEAKGGTLELLLSLPLTLWQAMLVKFLAAWLFIGLALALTFPIWLTVNYLGSPDNGVVFAGYLGSW